MNRRVNELQRGAIKAAVAGVALLAVAVTAVTGWVDWLTVGRWAQPQAALLGLWLLGGLLLAAAGYSWWRTRRPRPGRQEPRRSPPLSWWAVTAAALVIAAVAWGSTAWLLREAATADDPGTARVEAIKAGLGIGAGTGGVFALLLAVRRQWHQEIAAADVTFDAIERRVTDLYTKAADQLGSDKASVRLAGLYALERLAQDHFGQRQTIVNVLCAYLRMPFIMPGEPPDSGADDMVYARYHERRQEREVRLAAQRILATHIRLGTSPVGPASTFWAAIDLDLTGAVLIDLDLSHCQVRAATFTNAQFTGSARFNGAQFNIGAWFQDAQFTGSAWFQDAQFTAIALFNGAQFVKGAWFTRAQFIGGAWFTKARFINGAWFTKAQISGSAWFDEAQFTHAASFDEVQFTDGASFDKAQFTDDVSFKEVQFADRTWFNGVHFTGRAWFTGVQFADAVSFEEARFTRDVPPEVAAFRSSAASVEQQENDARRKAD